MVMQLTVMTEFPRPPLQLQNLITRRALQIDVRARALIRRLSSRLRFYFTAEGAT